MQVSETKIVYFDQYCKLCEHFLKGVLDDPCNECLTNPTNINSHKPVNFEEK